jgi:Domain of unknown function (DUF1843)
MHPIPPYGVAIQEAIASGDTARMRQVARESEEWLRQAEEVRGALEQLRGEIARAENGSAQ